MDFAQRGIEEWLIRLQWRHKRMRIPRIASRLRGHRSQRRQSDVFIQAEDALSRSSASVEKQKGCGCILRGRADAKHWLRSVGVWRHGRFLLKPRRSSYAMMSDLAAPNLIVALSPQQRLVM